MQNEVVHQLTELRVSFDNLRSDLDTHIKTEEAQQHSLHKDVQELKSILEQLRGAYKLVIWLGASIAAVGAAWTWLINHFTISVK